MILRTLTLSVSALALLAVSMPAAPARADGFSPVPAGVCGGYNSQSWGGAGDRFFEFNTNTNININKTFDFSKNINVFKSFEYNTHIDNSRNVNINKTFDFSKNIDVSRNINIYKNIDLSKHIEINKNIDISKNYYDFSKKTIINIHKSGKGGGDQSQNQEQNQNQENFQQQDQNQTSNNTNTNNNDSNASSDQTINLTINNTSEPGGGGTVNVFANSMANAFANATAVASAMQHQTFLGDQRGFGGGGSFTTVINRGGGNVGVGVAIEQEHEERYEECVEQWATVVKSIHAECIDSRGTRHPAVRMRPETWINTSLSEEIFRCLPGSDLHVVIGDVVDSDQGIAAVYEGGTTLVCRAGEALRHYQDGIVRCAVAEQLEDCVERTNMRRYGVGDVFFSFQAKVCARVVGARYVHSGRSERSRGYSERRIELQLNGMSLSGGVGW